MKKSFSILIAGIVLVSLWSCSDSTTDPKAEPKAEPKVEQKAEPKAELKVDPKVKADLMAAGQQKYVVCVACHGTDGKGMRPAPGMVMAASWVDSKILKKGSAEVIVAILMRGIKKVNPTEYMGQIMMPLGASMPDADVASIVTYVRNTFGGHDDIVTEAQVKEWRAKYVSTAGPMERKALEELAGVDK